VAGGFLLGMVVGVVLGLAVSLAVAFYLNKTPMPFTAKSNSAKPAEKTSPANDKTPIAGLPSNTPAPALPAEQPKFDFYKILPGQEEPVTEKELRERTRRERPRTFISFRRGRSRIRPRPTTRRRASRSSASSRASSRRTSPTRAPGTACGSGRTPRWMT
jgi:cell division protein FtsN